MATVTSTTLKHVNKTLALGSVLMPLKPWVANRDDNGCMAHASLFAGLNDWPVSGTFFQCFANCLPTVLQRKNNDQEKQQLDSFRDRIRPSGRWMSDGESCSGSNPQCRVFGVSVS
jgi:hypothetical protein